MIVPLLHSQKKCYLRINVLEDNKRLSIHFNPGSQGLNNGSSSSGRQYFIKSEMLTEKMKATLEKKFVEIRKEKMSEVGAMVKSEWKMIFSQKKPSDINSNINYYWPLAEFKDLCAACEGKSQLMFIIKG